MGLDLLIGMLGAYCGCNIELVFMEEFLVDLSHIPVVTKEFYIFPPSLFFSILPPNISSSPSLFSVFSILMPNKCCEGNC